MPDRRSSQSAMQSEHRHQVHRGQRFGGHVVDVAEVARVEVGGRHQVGEQLLVQSRSPPAPELVELHRDERRLGLTRQAGDGEGVRISFLEVVERAVHEVLTHLVPGALVAQVVRRSLAVHRFDGEGCHLVRSGVVGADLPDVAAHRVEERLLHLAAQVQQAWVPLPVRVHPCEPAVVQFVTDIERKL